MDRRSFLAGGAALATLGGRVWADVSAPPPTPVDDLRTAAREAWIYGLPLIEMARLRAAAIGPRPRTGTPGFNAFAHAPNPAGPRDRSMSAPEADVLYSSAWIHLGSGGARVLMPSSGGRYVCLALFDMYGDAFEVFESRGAGGAGREISLLGPPSHTGVSGYTAPLPQMPHILRPVIHTPGPWVWALARVHLEGEGDLEAARQVQAGFDIRIKPSEPAPAMPVSLDAAWSDYFFAVQKLIEENPPPPGEQPFFRRIAPLQLSMQGDFEQARFADAELEPVAAGVNDARMLLGQMRPDAAAGWIWPKPSLGAFGQDFLYRARCSRLLPGAPPRTVIMPLRAIAPDGGLAFDSARHWRLTLPGPPPADGFWSLTLYEIAPDGRLDLGANPLGRHALGDWSRGLKRQPNGAIDVWIGRADPGGARTANWLPAPSEAPFALVLRAYAPREDLLEQRYQPPPVKAL
jgi:hypothetical protein